MNAEQFQAGDTLSFQAQRRATLNGRTYRQGDVIQVTLATDWDPRADIGRGGPWGWGGFTTATLKRIATRNER